MVTVTVTVSVLYGTLFVVPHTHGAEAWITQCYLQLYQCLPLPRKRSPDGASQTVYQLYNSAKILTPLNRFSFNGDYLIQTQILFDVEC